MRLRRALVATLAVGLLAWHWFTEVNFNTSLVVPPGGVPGAE